MPERVRPVDAILTAFDRVESCDRPEVWIYLRPRASAVTAAAQVDPCLPLAGLTLAVKDNIDVAGMPTTAGCPAYAYVPRQSAPVVTRLEAAGAVVLGKTNLDQFATGLVGTRSPYGAVRNAVDARFISGGSSSGSAVAVALGLVDLALGTDTAGSGRVPAALNGIVGLKPTPGLLSTTGIVPACASFDCVSIFAASVGLARLAAELAAAYDPSDARSVARHVNGAIPGARTRPVQRVGIPRPEQLDFLGDTESAMRYAAAVERVSQHATVEFIDLLPFLTAGDLLYDGALVAERYAAVGAFIEANHDLIDPTVASIITAAGDLRAHHLAKDLVTLDRLRRVVATVWDHVDALLLPTTPTTFTLAEVLEDPIGRNAALGRYTNFCNPLGLCAVALPNGLRIDGLPVGMTLFGPAFSDRPLADFAAVVNGEPALPPIFVTKEPDAAPVTRSFLVVVGAHLRGEPLNYELTGRGAELAISTYTAPNYRLYALATTPPKPGLEWVPHGGGPIEVEVWELDPAAFADFVARVPAPLAIGAVQLADGRELPGFLCTPAGLLDAVDITEFGGWRAYRRAQPVA